MIRCLVVASAPGLTTMPAFAQTPVWPDRPICIALPQGQGGGADSFTRPIAMELQARFGHPVVVGNRGGAGGTMGALNAALSQCAPPQASSDRTTSA